MTQPTSSEPQFARSLSQQAHRKTSQHSTSTPTASSSQMVRPSVSHKTAGTARADKPEGERATDLAAQSWDLASGGLKILTAKRELPYLSDRRPADKLLNLPELLEAAVTPRSDIFILVIMVCIVLMLISGGIVLLMMLS